MLVVIFQKATSKHESSSTKSFSSSTTKSSCEPSAGSGAKTSHSSDVPRAPPSTTVQMAVADSTSFAAVGKRKSAVEEDRKELKKMKPDNNFNKSQTTQKATAAVKPLMDIHIQRRPRVNYPKRTGLTLSCCSSRNTAATTGVF